MPDPITQSLFLPFSRLPAEIRAEIWRAALPSHPTRALFNYRSDLWKQIDVDSELRTSKLTLPLNFPVASTSHEARHVAQAWAWHHGLTKMSDQYPRPFLRSFNPEHDILYVPASRFDCFIRGGPGASGGAAPAPDITSVAVLIALFDDRTCLRSLWKHYPRVKILYVILEATAETPGPGEWWELGEDLGGAWKTDWNDLERLKWVHEMAQSEFTAPPDISVKPEALEGIRRDLHAEHFEVRPVRVVIRRTTEHA
ncbi:hypothetical protein K461DRAFT_297923 [Myriangium duriaei CBS 260.36]|uniref:2EXR domain-containing protein n=1 Tax=Myriangium duriaei CBS 260.36 TaxID=1168546 RepID=A0A9P4MI53_9PEZI|nr:hypothetical protein K461DRAFT_297923 [Myriangium duriaei CBS 260.36]